jgi:hypothetical protein
LDHEGIAVAQRFSQIRSPDAPPAFEKSRVEAVRVVIDYALRCGHHLRPIALGFEKPDSAHHNGLVMWRYRLSRRKKRDRPLKHMAVSPVASIGPVKEQYTEQADDGTKRRGVNIQSLFIKSLRRIVTLKASWLVLQRSCPQNEVKRVGVRWPLACAALTFNLDDLDAQGRGNSTHNRVLSGAEFTYILIETGSPEMCITLSRDHLNVHAQYRT